MNHLFFVSVGNMYVYKFCPMYVYCLKSLLEIQSNNDFKKNVVMSFKNDKHIQNLIFLLSQTKRIKVNMIYIKQIKNKYTFKK